MPALHAAVDIHHDVDRAPPASPQTDLHTTAQHHTVPILHQIQTHLLDLCFFAGWPITIVIGGIAESSELCSLSHIQPRAMELCHAISAATELAASLG